MFKDLTFFYFSKALDLVSRRKKMKNEYTNLYIDDFARKTDFIYLGLELSKEKRLTDFTNFYHDLKNFNDLILTKTIVEFLLKL